jgi:hypothetical protein
MEKQQQQTTFRVPLVGFSGAIRFQKAKSMAAD